MEPIILNNIPDEVLLDDIKELTQEFPIEFPNLFKQIKDYLNVDTQNIYITDFVEDENNSDYFYGYFFDILSRKMHKYSFEKDKSKFEVMDDVFSDIMNDEVEVIYNNKKEEDEEN